MVDQYTGCPSSSSSGGSSGVRGILQAPVFANTDACLVTVALSWLCWLRIGAIAICVSCHRLISPTTLDKSQMGRKLQSVEEIGSLVCQKMSTLGSM